MTFYLLLDENKKQSSKEIARLLEEKTADLGGEVLVQESNMDMSMLGGSGIELEVRGTDLDQMEEIVRDMTTLLQNTEGTEEVTNGLEDNTKELRITVNKK